MTHVAELTVVLKDDEKRLSNKFLLYEPFLMDPSNETIQSCVAIALKSFSGEPTDVCIRVSMTL